MTSLGILFACHYNAIVGHSQPLFNIRFTNMAFDEVTLLKRDHQYLWHPCSQMKDYEQFPPAEIIKARGSTLYLKDGHTVIDAISSWWCKSLGHNEPRLKQALLAQMEKFEHVLLANTTNETIVNLSEKLAQLCDPLNKCFYASDGSSSVEIALKMSLHSRAIRGQKKRNQFLALEQGYHGETLGALSVSDLKLYRLPYEPLLFKSHFIGPLPYVSGINDPLWHDCSAYWPDIETSLQPYTKTATALICEPIMQGAAPMKIYSADLLKRLRAWCSTHDIHLIADEIMTGIGRTGKMLACEHAGITPDFLCLAKGLTSGWLPLSVVMTHHDIYQLFYDDHKTGKAFLHSHTHSGNALAASIAVEVLNIMEQENICQKAVILGNHMLAAMQDIAHTTGKLKDIRQLGAMVAADFTATQGKRWGFEIAQRAFKLGALLRPIGNTLYWLPPLNMPLNQVDELKAITQQALS